MARKDWDRQAGWNPEAAAGMEHDLKLTLVTPCFPSGLFGEIELVSSLI